MSGRDFPGRFFAAPPRSGRIKAVILGSGRTIAGEFPMPPLYSLVLRTARVTAIALAAMLLSQASAIAQSAAERLTLQDLRPGTPLDKMPDVLAFRNYACGSNGGPPLKRLSGWADYKQCRPDENGLYEVYFEYDNEAEYILRALGDPRAVRFIGTTEQGFPVVVSALFDEGGTLRGVRMVTDPRPDFTADDFFDLSDLRTRADFYLLGPFVGGQVGINPATDCVTRPLGPKESKVGNTYVKLDCERVQGDLRSILRTRLFRKPGQNARDPLTGQLTQGQFESSTVFEQYQVGFGPKEPANAPNP
jgi:hypothetical protein